LYDLLSEFFILAKHFSNGRATKKMRKIGHQGELQPLEKSEK